eukprot:CAMPEP_0119523942 /NCGR_PEP_ID=MMETSP1344-20130328/38939_1 /TAXON_ID=236787 /ORGANISM="Florenciella parvula, Strain CCMP2471" /LENGTH=45 /DNA_ID= /DNA_START= /DNA_END= /DNA_ORIENTATION=
MVPPTLCTVTLILLSEWARARRGGGERAATAGRTGATVGKATTTA